LSCIRSFKAEKIVWLQGTIRETLDGELDYALVTFRNPDDVNDLLERAGTSNQLDDQGES